MKKCREEAAEAEEDCAALGICRPTPVHVAAAAALITAAFGAPKQSSVPRLNANQHTDAFLHDCWRSAGNAAILTPLCVLLAVLFAAAARGLPYLSGVEEPDYKHAE